MNGWETRRVDPVTDREEAPEEGVEHFDRIAETRGSVRGPFAVLMHDPDLCGRIARVGERVRYEGSLPDPVRELAILATARAYDCAYEWAAHESIARDAGVSDDAIEAVVARASTQDLPDQEALVVTYVRKLLGENGVSDDTFRAARDRFGPDGLVELTAIVGYYGLIACVCNAFEVVPEADTPLS